MTTRRWFHRQLLRLPYKQPLLCLTVSLWVSGFAWFQLVSIQMVWFECALDEFAFHTLRSPVHSIYHTFTPFVLSHPSHTLSTLLQDELFRLKILFFMTQLLHLGSSNRNTIIPYTHGPSRNCEATAIDNSQTPLLDQKEEQKTKLPFCIFLLSNGAVGTRSARR